MTAPTLPAMIEDDILKLYTTATGKRLPNMGPTRPELFRIARAIIAARDAQWAARLDAAVRDERERWISHSLAALYWMEGAWHRIDSEWGPCGKSLDEACADGDEPEIAGLRARTKD